MFFKPGANSGDPAVKVTDGSLAAGVTITIDGTEKTITLVFKGNPDETVNNVTETLKYVEADAAFSVDQVKAGIEEAVKAVKATNAQKGQWDEIVDAIQTALETAAQTSAATAWGVTAEVTFEASLTDRFEALPSNGTEPITGTVTINLTFDSAEAGTIDVGEMTVLFTNKA